MSGKEGAGLRSPKQNSVRAEIYRLFTEDPRAILGRKALADGFGVNIKTVDQVVNELRREGVIVTVSGYQLADSVKAPSIIPRKPPQPRKHRQAAQPRVSQPASRVKGPRVASIFELGEAMQRGARVA